jgi:protein involved in polysaccharide export with SLBB domain
VIRILSCAAAMLLLAAAAAADPAPPAEAPAEAVAESPEWSLDRPVDRERYRLGPGDRLLLVLEGRSLRRVPLTVLPEGLVDWEGGLQLSVGGLSLAEAEARAAAALADWMPDVTVRLLLLEPRRLEVYVLGEVRHPGPVELRASARVVEALRAAGGPGPRGSQRFVELLDTGGARQRLDLYPFRMAGDWSANPYVPPGQVLYVPVRQDTVLVIGEVNRTGTYEWSEGETLGTFLDYAQGFTQDALQASILLERDEREVEIHLVSETDRQMPLRPGDVLVVGSRKPLLNRVFLEGAGERTGEIYLSPGETLGDLVRRLGDTRGRALPEQAILERRREDRNHFQRVNLRELLQGRGPVDLPIENDDVLYVPIRSNQVFVLGEVETPGALIYNPSWNVGKYLALAGGTTARGSRGKLRIIDVDGVERRVRTTDHLHRGDILLVGRSTLSIFTDVLLAAVSVSSLILAVNALSK